MDKYLKYNFHDIQLNSLNPVRRYWHRARHKTISGLVNKYYNGGSIYDLGCGNCNWNAGCYYPVIGVDHNYNSLDYTKSIGRIIKGIVSPLENIQLECNAADLVVCTETLEHIQEYNKVCSEMYRIIKSNQYAVISVPYDTNLSLWKPLFKMICWYEGTIKKHELYKQECGHINHFSPQAIADVFKHNGFSIIELKNLMFMTIILVVRKEDNEK